jgi:hypothetical protein
MQDAIYNQIQWATNTANMPYQDYKLDTVAPLSAMQKQAYQNVQDQQGAWKPNMNTAVTGMTGLTTSGTAEGLKTAQNNYLNPNLTFPPSRQPSGYGPEYGDAITPQMMMIAPPPTGADLAGRNLSEGQSYFNQAGQQNMVGASAPYMNQANTSAANIVGTSTPYLNSAATAAGNITSSAQPYFEQASSAANNITGAANPYLNQAGSTTAQALSDRALSAANPYLQAAAQSSASNVGQYMSPYQQNAMDVIAQQGARNLSENLLPGVSDAFIKAGQFGSSRMGEFGSRALRDTQQAILNQQATMANQGYGQALGASSADLARQAQLAGTVGSISGADLSRVLQGGAQYGNLAQTAGGLNAQQASSLSNIGQATGQLTAQQASALNNIGQTFGSLAGQQANAYANQGQTMGQLTGQQMQNLANLGQMQTTAGQAQQQYGLSAAQAAQQAQAADYSRQLQANTGLAALTAQQNAMRSGDIASLEAAGAAEQGQAQKVLSAAQQEFQNQQLYPKQQLDWLNTQVRGMAPITPTTTTNQGTTTGATYSASPLAQLASGAALYKGLSNLG